MPENPRTRELEIPGVTRFEQESLGQSFYGLSLALVIGVSNYQDPHWNDLPGAAKDARLVDEALKKHGFESSLVIDPDHEALDQVFKEYLQGGKFHGASRGRLLIYYAGHGYTEPGLPELRTGYLVPADAPPPRDPAFRLKYLGLEQIHGYSRPYSQGTSPHHVLCLFDSCFSGQLLETMRGSPADSPPADVQALLTEPSRQFITSGSADQPVPDDSHFRKAFVRALAGEFLGSGTEFFTGLQLYAFLRRWVLTNRGKDQTPQFGEAKPRDLFKGDFVFRVPNRERTEELGPPPSAVFDPSDLLEEADESEPARETSRAQWAQWLQKMEEHYRLGQELEVRDIALEIKQRYWQRFLSDYATSSPWSDRDDELRDLARVHLEALSQPLGARIAWQPSDTSGAIQIESFSGMKFRSVAPGVFAMGSPSDEEGRNPDEALHEVRISRGFWIGETPVTQGQWAKVMEDNPSFFADCGDDCPVERVDWYAAIEFTNRLSEAVGLEPCYEFADGEDSSPERKARHKRVLFKGLDCCGFRLPTEAEWEFAARAGRSGAFWMGDIISTDQANFDGTFPYRGEARGKFRQKTTSVTRFKPNPWGLRDVHGNVAEWVWDLYTPELSPTIDPLGPNPDDPPVDRDLRRVIRGGGYLDNAAGCRSADRLPAAPGYLDSNLGFRVARSGPVSDKSS